MGTVIVALTSFLDVHTSSSHARMTCSPRAVASGGASGLRLKVFSLCRGADIDLRFRRNPTQNGKRWCLVMDDRPDDDLIRELYAMFGLAYYQSECLHRELSMIWAESALPARDLITGSRVEERLAQAYAMTFGEVAAQLKGVLPADLEAELQSAVEIRNFLAHHFWFERAHLMHDVDNLCRIIDEIHG